MLLILYNTSQQCRSLRCNRATEYFHSCSSHLAQNAFAVQYYVSALSIVAICLWWRPGRLATEWYACNRFRFALCAREISRVPYGLYYVVWESESSRDFAFDQVFSLIWATGSWSRLAQDWISRFIWIEPFTFEEIYAEMLLFTGGIWKFTWYVQWAARAYLCRLDGVVGHRGQISCGENSFAAWDYLAFFSWCDLGIGEIYQTTYLKTSN